MAWRPTYNFDLHAGAGPRLGPRRGERLRRVETPGTETPERLPGGQPRGARTTTGQNEGRHGAPARPDRAARAIVDPNQINSGHAGLHGAGDAVGRMQCLFPPKENRDVRRIFHRRSTLYMWGPLPKPPSEFYVLRTLYALARPFSPYITQAQPYDFAVDWWALGILVGELATGSTPFHAETPRQLMASILNDAPTLPEDEALAVTLEALLEKEPHSRPLADDVRAAPAFSNTDWHAVEQLLAPPFPELDEASYHQEPSPAMEVSRVTTSPESSLEATTALDRRRVHRTMSAPLQMPPPPPRTQPRAQRTTGPRAPVSFARVA